jgi:hypothetical protein
VNDGEDPSSVTTSYPAQAQRFNVEAVELGSIDLFVLLMRFI